MYLHLATVIISTFDILEGVACYRRLIGKPRRGFEGLLIGLLLIQHVPRVSSQTLNMRSRIVVSIAVSTRLRLYVCIYMYIQYILVSQVLYTCVYLYMYNLFLFYILFYIIYV